MTDPTIVLVQTILWIFVSLMVGLYGFSIYRKEVLWPERVLLRKKREGGEEVTWELAKIVEITDKEGEKTKYLRVYGERIGKHGKAIDKDYKPGFTKGLLNRLHNYWELYSPTFGAYYFVKNTINVDGIKGQALSSSEREHLVNSMRRSLFLTQTKKDMWSKLEPYVPMISAVIVFITIMIAIFIVPEIVVKGIAEKIGDAAYRGVSRAVESVNSTVQTI